MASIDGAPMCDVDVISLIRFVALSSFAYHCHPNRIIVLFAVSVTPPTCVSVYTEVTREKLSKCDILEPVSVPWFDIFKTILRSKSKRVTPVIVVGIN